MSATEDDRHEPHDEGAVPRPLDSEASWTRDEWDRMWRPSMWPRESPGEHGIHAWHIVAIVALTAYANIITNRVLDPWWHIPFNLGILGVAVAIARHSGAGATDLGYRRDRISRGLVVGGIVMGVIGAGILVGVAISIGLEQRYRWAAKLSGPVIGLLIAMTLSTCGVMPVQAPVYDLIGEYLIPMAIPLLLFEANITRIIKLSGKTFIAFQIAWKLYYSRWNLKRDQSRRPRVLFLADRNTLANQAFNSFDSFPDDALVRIDPEAIKKKGAVREPHW